MGKRPKSNPKVKDNPEFEGQNCNRTESETEQDLREFEAKIQWQQEELDLKEGDTVIVTLTKSSQQDLSRVDFYKVRTLQGRIGQIAKINTAKTRVQISGLKQNGKTITTWLPKDNVLRELTAAEIASIKRMGNSDQKKLTSKELSEAQKILDDPEKYTKFAAHVKATIDGQDAQCHDGTQ